MNVFKKIFSKIFKSNDKKTSVESRWQSCESAIESSDFIKLPITFQEAAVLTTSERISLGNGLLFCSPQQYEAAALSSIGIEGVPRTKTDKPDKKSQHRSIFEDWEVTQDS